MNSAGIGLPGKILEDYNEARGLYGDRIVTDYMKDVAARLEQDGIDIDELFLSGWKGHPDQAQSDA